MSESRQPLYYNKQFNVNQEASNIFSKLSTLLLFKISIPKPKSTHTNQKMAERVGEETSIEEQYANPDFEIAYFSDQFMDLFRKSDDPILNFTSDIYDFDCLNDDVTLMNPVAEFNSPQNDDVEETESSPEKRKKSDRSTTLISERRRRRRMKEKLYALRSLVPNITKVTMHSNQYCSHTFKNNTKFLQKYGDT